MCYPTTCPKCGKTTWGGCGQHVDDVMCTVPATQRCTCTEKSAPRTSSTFFRSLFGR